MSLTYYKNSTMESFFLYSAHLFSIISSVIKLVNFLLHFKVFSSIKQLFYYLDKLKLSPNVRCKNYDIVLLLQCVMLSADNAAFTLK